MGAGVASSGRNTPNHCTYSNPCRKAFLDTMRRGREVSTIASVHTTRVVDTWTNASVQYLHVGVFLEPCAMRRPLDF